MSIVWVRPARREPAASRVARMGDEERNVGDLLVEVHPVLGPEIMLAEEETVIGRDDQRGVGPKIVRVEMVDANGPNCASHSATRA